MIDPTGKMDPLPLMSTGPLMTAKQMIELYVDRWSLEVTFEETREHLGVETVAPMVRQSHCQIHTYFDGAL